MSEPAGRVAVACPSCSPGDRTVHELLSTGGGLATVRCAECGHVHKEEPPREDAVERTVVVSQDGESIAATVDVPPDETLRVGEEFIVDTPEAIFAVRITGLEVGDDRREDDAVASRVETIWTRAVDNVTVNVTIHPADGARDETRSVAVGVPGDHEFVVGTEETHGEASFTVTGVIVRDDAEGYAAPKLDRDGDAVPAKDVKRVFARETGVTSAWSGW